ncbi:MAG: hypothetical protein IT204_19415 [Fimbriimonadaceae bacterium]|nr:hypothetical protein [Fimbriimonadaceae bacterium]
MTGRGIGCLLLLLTSAAAQPSGVLLHETWASNQRAWRVDEFSKLDQDAYLVDARNTGGYYRWIEQPADLGDFSAQLTLSKVRGNNVGPLYGLLLRVQDSWRNSYFFVVNGAGGYLFGRFRAGQAALLKQGQEPSLAKGGSQTLTVRASGETFSLGANGVALATVTDGTFSTAGRIGVCVEAPAMVRFEDLLVTSLDGSGGTAGGPPAGSRGVLFEDDFGTNRGWDVDARRELRDGAYYLQCDGQGPSRSFLSWNRQTAALEDGDYQLEVRFERAAANTLAGLLWRITDGTHFYFAVLGEAGNWLVGVWNGDQPTVLRRGVSTAIRPLQQANRLEVIARGSHFEVRLNDAVCGSFVDSTHRSGAVGVYLEQAGQVAFDNLRVVAPPAGPGSGRTSWPQGELRLHDPLDGQGGVWPQDADHRFSDSAYEVRGPAQGSRTTLWAASMAHRAAGVVSVVVQPLEVGPDGTYGLVVAADAAAENFWYLLLTGTGKYFAGRCVNRVFETLDSAALPPLRGEAGNTLQVTLAAGQLRYGLNDQPLGQLPCEATGGAIGLHVENGARVRFRDLRLHALPEVGR